ncbi:MAG TPA: hypothetical protein VJK52_05760 [Candidatus Nanoarchaeia archaeon]|nr:hypothetical protein [Candidatus Nanoarchaeia archaeon]
MQLSKNQLLIGMILFVGFLALSKGQSSGAADMQLAEYSSDLYPYADIQQADCDEQYITLGNSLGCQLSDTGGMEQYGTDAYFATKLTECVDNQYMPMADLRCASDSCGGTQACKDCDYELSGSCRKCNKCAKQCCKEGVRSKDGCEGEGGTWLFGTPISRDG